MSPRSRNLAAALALLLAAACAAAAQNPPADEPGGGSAPARGADAQEGESGAFVVAIGRDTLAVEEYTRARGRLTGTVVSRSPRTVTRTYTATLRPDGSISRLETTTTTAGQPAVTAVVDLTADSAVSQMQRGDSAWTVRVAARNPLPLVSFSQALYEQAMMHARAARRDSVSFTLVPPGSRQTAALAVHLGADSAQLVNIAGRQRVATDARGRLLGLNGLESTQKFIVTRVPDVDMAAMTAEFTRRDAAGQGVGPLSPRDSAVAHVGGAHLAIDYGRPFARGRRVMGEVVPWGEVWRTGANAATGFTTTRDLEIGGVAVPAGAYTLWTLPTPEGWKLIVNRQTGQWGTEYHQERDVARIDMQVRRAEPRVEQFTIRIEPGGGVGNGIIRLAWDDTEAFVPFTVK